MGAQDPFEQPFPAACSLALQGVRLRLASNCRELVDYAPEHLHGHGLPPGARHDVEVNVLWLERGAFDPERHRFAGLERLDRIGKRALRGEGQLVCLELLTVKRLQLRFRLADSRLVVDAIYRFDPEKKGSERSDEVRVKEFFRSMLHLVYYPLIWVLERERGLHLLHASAVEIGGRAVLIAGVGGVGKSTTGVALASRPGARFLSESLVLYDAAEVYGCYEPLRLGDESLALLGPGNGLLMEAAIDPEAKKKNIFHVVPERRAERAPLGSLFVPRFAARGGVRPLAAEGRVDRLLSINTQSRKVNDYYWFAAALGLEWPGPGCAEDRAAALGALLGRAPAFELDIDPRAGVAPVVDAILRHS